MDKETMPRVDLEKDIKRITLLEKNCMKLIEKKNLERALDVQKKNKRSLRVGLTLGATVISIYLYTIFKVKQERFLDDFNEPEKTTD